MVNTMSYIKSKLPNDGPNKLKASEVVHSFHLGISLKLIIIIVFLGHISVANADELHVTCGTRASVAVASGGFHSDLTETPRIPGMTSFPEYDSALFI